MRYLTDNSEKPDGYDSPLFTNEVMEAQSLWVICSRSPRWQVMECGVCNPDPSHSRVIAKVLTWAEILQKGGERPKKRREEGKGAKN